MLGSNEAHLHRTRERVGRLQLLNFLLYHLDSLLLDEKVRLVEIRHNDKGIYTGARCLLLLIEVKNVLTDRCVAGDENPFIGLGAAHGTGRARRGRRVGPSHERRAAHERVATKARTAASGSRRHARRQAGSAGKRSDRA